MPVTRCLGPNATTPPSCSKCNSYLGHGTPRQSPLRSPLHPVHQSLTSKEIKALSKKKTLNCLQEPMQKFQFQIICKKGSEMPTNYLSRNLVHSIGWQNSQIQHKHETDPLIRTLWDHLQLQHVPVNDQLHQLFLFFAMDSFIQGQLIWHQLP
jgi:hypothetical protein